MEKSIRQTRLSDFRENVLKVSFDPTNKYGKYGAFLKPEEADGFQKEFGKGGYVGIQGNVENDSFTGDKCLKVSGFFSAEKPPKRKDTAERKTVPNSP